MAIIMSSDSDELSPRSSPVTVDYTGSAPDSPMPSNVSSVNSNSFVQNKDKTISSSALKTSYVSTNSELNDENVVNKPSIPFSITSILNRGDPQTKYSKQDNNANIESQMFRYCQSALDPLSLSAAVLSSRQQPIVSVSSVLAAAGHQLPKKPTPWYPWAVSSGVVGNGHTANTSAHHIVFRESRDSVFNQRSISTNNNNGSVSPINSKLSHNYAERSDSRSMASSPLSPSPCVGHCNASHSDNGNDIDMDDDNASDSCSEKDSQINKNKINENTRVKDHSNHSNLQNINAINNNNNRRKKKTRTVFTRSQVFQLESTFDMKRYLSSSERAGLAASLHLTETQNRRNKWKRQLAAELEAANMAHAAAQRIRAVPILYHTTPGHHHHTHDANGNPNPQSNSSSSHADSAAASLQAALSSYYYHPSHHTSSTPFITSASHVSSVASAATAAAIRTPTISGLV